MPQQNRLQLTAAQIVAERERGRTPIRYLPLSTDLESEIIDMAAGKLQAASREDLLEMVSSLSDDALRQALAGPLIDEVRTFVGFLPIGLGA